MACVTLSPCRLSGSIQVPPSKSIAHRAILCAALAKGESRLSPVDVSEDMKATLEGAQALGASYLWDGDELFLWGKTHVPPEMPVIDCRESGSTLRFLIPLTLAIAEKGAFLCHGKLGSRPLTPYEAVFSKRNIAFSQRPRGGDVLELTVQGRLTPGNYALPGDVSSQFITGLLMALPLLPGDSEILLTTSPSSAGYIQLTLDAMEAFGVQASWPEPRRFFIPGGQNYQPRSQPVEGDYSQAAVFLCAAALGHKVFLKGLNPASHQGDRAVMDILGKMGADLSHSPEGISYAGGTLHGIEIDGDPFPDVLPMLALVCCLSKGESRIVNAGRLRLKECDRLSATVQELSALGADIRAEGDALLIQGKPCFPGGVTVDSHNDHRMAMMLSIAALHCESPIQLTGADSVKKSWPGYWRDYQSLGGKNE